MKRFYMVASILVFAAANFYIFIDGIHCTKDFILMNRRISFTEMTADPPRITEILDVDRDGEDEVFHSYSYLFPNKQAVSLFEPLQRHYNRLYYGEILVPIGYTFFGVYYDEDLQTYVFRFLDYEKGKLFLTDVDNRGYLRKQLEVKGLSLMLNPKVEMTFLKSLVVDLEGDGKKELIVFFKQDDQTSPSVILCIDPLSGELLWNYPAGTVIVEAECRDLDNNNKKEIILSTFSSLKGVEINGTSDAYSYVIVLESNGNKRWNEKIGDRYTFTRTAIADIDNDNLLDIIAATEVHPKRGHSMEKIFVFDGPTGKPKANSPIPLYNVSFSKPLVHRSKAGTRIYVGDSNGNIRMFDHHLKPLKTINIKEKAQVQVLKASSSSFSWDYVFAYSQGQLMAYDRELERKMFSFNFPPPTPFSDLLTPPILMPLKTKSGHHALVNSDKLYLISQSESSSFLKNLLNSGLLFSGFIFLLMNGLFLYFIYIYKMVPRFRKHSKKREAEVSQSLEVFQAIAHQFKNPIGTMTWTAEKIKRSVQKGQKNSSTDYFQLAEFLVDDVKTMRRHSDNILKLVQIQVPKLRKKRLKPLFQKLVRHYKTIVNEKIEVEFEMKEDVSVHLDEELFKEAMVNLLDNAIDAMPEGGKLRVSVVPVVSPEKGSPQHVLIEIEDTGSGIDEADISQLFTPFFTKKGTGLGLTICKRIIKAHGGTIAVHSRKGFGTKFATKIPVQ